MLSMSANIHFGKDDTPTVLAHQSDRPDPHFWFDIGAGGYENLAFHFNDLDKMQKFVTALNVAWVGLKWPVQADETVPVGHDDDTCVDCANPINEDRHAVLDLAGHGPVCEFCAEGYEVLECGTGV